MAVDAVDVLALVEAAGLATGLVGGAVLGIHALRKVYREVMGLVDADAHIAGRSLSSRQVAAIKAKEAAGSGSAGGGDYSGLGVDYSSYSKDELFALNDRLYAEIGYGPDGEIPADKMDKHYQLFEVQDEIERRMR